MRRALALVGLASSLAFFPARAQEPVVGAPDAEALFTSPDPTLHRNKQAAYHIQRDLIEAGHWELADRWLTERYIQHNPNAASGRAGVVAYFTQVMKVKRLDKCDRLTTEDVAVIAEDDYVTVMMPRKYPDPRKAGAEYYTTWFDTWRFVNGKADEHWDNALITAPAAR